jgi:four helix bundle protein
MWTDRTHVLGVMYHVGCLNRNMPEKEKINSRNQSFKIFLSDKITAFVVPTVKLTELMNSHAKLRPISNQLIRSSTSIGANVHEAQGCSSRKEYRRYFEHALKSAHETVYWLFLVTKLETKLALRAHKLMKECEEIKKVLARSVSSLKQ